MVFFFTLISTQLHNLMISIAESVIAAIKLRIFTTKKGNILVGLRPRLNMRTTLMIVLYLVERRNPASRELVSTQPTAQHRLWPITLGYVREILRWLNIPAFSAINPQSWIARSAGKFMKLTQISAKKKSICYREFVMKCSEYKIPLSADFVRIYSNLKF